MENKGQDKENRMLQKKEDALNNDNFVLEKNIFSNVFEKDIRRVFIYKKAERLAKAIHLVAPAFRSSPSLQSRMDAVAVNLLDAAVLPPLSARDRLSRELLALTSVLSVARSSGTLSSMNAELIAREAQFLLQEVAAYEEPRVFLEEAPTLAELSRELTRQPSVKRPERLQAGVTRVPTQDKGHKIKDTNNDRKEAILSVLKERNMAGIKDISTVIRDVSEKTLQRELQALIKEGAIKRSGERRWSVYSIV